MERDEDVSGGLPAPGVLKTAVPCALQGIKLRKQRSKQPFAYLLTARGSSGTCGHAGIILRECGHSETVFEFEEHLEAVARMRYIRKGLGIREVKF